jgi:hypothetical protein
MSGQAGTGYPTGLGIGVYAASVVFHTARIVEAPDTPQAAAK